MTIWSKLCWAHAPQVPRGLADRTGAASVAIKWIADLYAHHRRIETFADRLAGAGTRWMSNRTTQDRRSHREPAPKWMKPVVDELEAWNARMVRSATEKESLGEAIGYFRNQIRPSPSIPDPRETGSDNNIIERSIRPSPSVARLDVCRIRRRRQAGCAADEPGRILQAPGDRSRRIFGDVLLRAKACKPTAGCADLTPSRWKAGRAK
ncbi:MAG: transposase [Fibrobacteres bacterium]|nr:transposase [Fibrobacterota bacterium]